LARIGYAALDGKVLAATGGLLQGVSVAQRLWFKNGLKNVTVEEVRRPRCWRRCSNSAKTASRNRFVDIVLPIRDASGATLGVLRAHLN
jgi:hypothetical protein